MWKKLLHKLRKQRYDADAERQLFERIRIWYERQYFYCSLMLPTDIISYSRENAIKVMSWVKANNLTSRYHKRLPYAQMMRCL